VLYGFLSALQQKRAQSTLLYLFHDKESDNFPTHAAELSKPNFIFQAAESGLSRVLFSDKARYNKPITIIVRIVQVI